MSIDIYLLFNENPAVRDTYIGSTCDLEKRMANHGSKTRNFKNTGKSSKLYKSLNKYDTTKWLCKRLGSCDSDIRYNIEQFYLDTYKPNLNTRRARGLGSKQYYQINKDKLIDYQKEYYQSKRELIKSKARTKFTCDCGGKFTASNKLAHMNSRKHKQFVNN